MKKWKQKGSKHYKGRGEAEPLDLIIQGGTEVIKGFCLGNIIKYASRSLRMYYYEDELEKIIHYAEVLKEEIWLPRKNKSIELRQKESPLSEKKKT